jgi:hypothetical protein
MSGRVLGGTRSRTIERPTHGWTELVDRSRDLGTAVPADLTRHQQGRIIGFAALAAAADAAVSGAADPSGEVIDRYWKATVAAIRAVTRDAGLVRRVLHRNALTSLLFREPRPIEILPSSTPSRRPQMRRTRPARSGT